MTALWRSLFAVLIVLTCCAGAEGRVRGKVEVGWDGVYRVGRWTPVFITLADDQAAPARNVVLEILAPHDNAFAMRIRQLFAISTEPATHTVYLPLTYSLDETIVIVRDPATGRKLFESTADNQAVGGQPGTFSVQAQGRDDVVAGVSGQKNAFAAMQGAWRWADANASPQPNQGYVQQSEIRSGFLEERRLPDAIQGYDGLDVLVLSAVDLSKMALERQQAIAQWVRGGGRLLMWPAPGPVPPDSPIAQLLPCRIGDAEVIELTLADTRVVGLASRQEKVGARRLEPLPQARTMKILNDKAIACFGRAGLGEVAVLSIDAGQLIFESSEKPKDFWRPILRDLVQPAWPGSRANYGWNLPPEEHRRLAAMEAVVNQLGDVPGVGTFDFSYIAIVMIAMMIIVGPVDWFVLKKLGRQPWTWVTTTGWITLITTGALYIGYVFRSGNLYYRTVRLVDQADGQVVGGMDVVGIYSPKTQRYVLEGQRNEWWEPANIEAVMPWRRQRAAREIGFVQDGDGNRLSSREGMFINVWSLQFLEGELGDPGGEPPLLRADLKRIVDGQGNARIVGTVTNLASAPLNGIWIRTRHGVANLAREGAAAWPAEVRGVLAPKQSVSIDAPVEVSDTLKPPENVTYNYYYYGQQQPNPYAESGQPALGLLKATCDLAAKRSELIEQLLRTRDDLACVYATYEMPAPVIQLVHGNRRPPIENHWQMVRAMVELK